MSDETDVDPGLMVAEDEQMNEEKRELKQGSLLENQTTVRMTGNKVTKVATPNKRGRKKKD